LFGSSLLDITVLSSPATIREQSTHDIKEKKEEKRHLFGLLGPQNVKIHHNLNINFFTMTILSPSGK